MYKSLIQSLKSFAYSITAKTCKTPDHLIEAWIQYRVEQGKEWEIPQDMKWDFRNTAAKSYSRAQRYWEKRHE